MEWRLAAGSSAVLTAREPRHLVTCETGQRSQYVLDDCVNALPLGSVKLIVVPLP
jgi:hypothetical protein